MSSILLRVDDILRGSGWTLRASRWTTLLQLSCVVIVFGCAYGAVMGSYGGIMGERMWQVCYTAVKVPCLLLVTFLITLPSFFVLNTLFGLRDDFGDAVQAVIATQAGLAIILASFAPLTFLWYASFNSYSAAVLFNAAAFCTASLSAQGLLRQHYRLLILRNPRHGQLLWAWLIVYAFVGIQMGWILRPFVGSPSAPVQFFREDTWGNAYIIVARLIWHMFVP